MTFTVGNGPAGNGRGTAPPGRRFARALFSDEPRRARYPPAGAGWVVHVTAPGYGASPAALREAAEGIRSLVAELGELTTVGRADAGRGIIELDLGPDRLGHEGLATVFTAFCVRWEWGVRELVRAGTEMADGLHESGLAYQDAEDQVGSTMSRLLSDVAGDPLADPEQEARRTPEEIVAPPPPDAWARAGESIAATWTDVGRDVLATGTDRISRALAGDDPFAPEIDALREIVD